MDVSAGSFTLDALRESARRHDSEVTNDATDYGILITTSALYDAKVKDENKIAPSRDLT